MYFSLYKNINIRYPILKHYKMQSKLHNKDIEYHSEFINKINQNEQHIRLSDGCFRSCWNCYAPNKKVWYKVPEIVRNKVIFYDMNFLWAYPDPLETIKQLGEMKVNGKVVYYDFWCGLDYTLLTPEIAKALKESRFGRFNNKRNYNRGLRIAWDRSIKEQCKFIEAIKMLDQVGYNRREHQVFMLVNGKIGFKECSKKLQILLYLHLKVCDCWYDKQKRGSVDPKFSWIKTECDFFGKLCRDHNIIIAGNGIHLEYLKN